MYFQSGINSKHIECGRNACAREQESEKKKKKRGGAKGNTGPVTTGCKRLYNKQTNTKTKTKTEACKQTHK